MGNRIFAAMVAAAVAATVFTSGSMTVFAAEADAVSEAAETVKVPLSAEAVEALRQVFDAVYYAEHNEDLAAIADNAEALFEHYINFGIYEGRSASEAFNAYIYATANEDVNNAFSGDLNALILHYANFGKDEGRIASAEVWDAKQTASAKTNEYMYSGGGSSGTSDASGSDSQNSADYIYNWGVIKYRNGELVNDSVYYNGDVVYDIFTGQTVVIGETFTIGTVGHEGTYVSTGNGYRLEQTYNSLTYDASTDPTSSHYIDPDTGEEVGLPAGVALDNDAEWD